MGTMLDKALENSKRVKREFIEQKFRNFMEKRFEEKLKKVQEWKKEGEVCDITTEEVGFVNQFIKEGKRLGFFLSKIPGEKIQIVIPPYESGEMTKAQAMLREFNYKLEARREEERELAQKISKEIFGKIKEGNFQEDGMFFRKYHFTIKNCFLEPSSSKVFDEALQKIIEKEGFCEIRFLKGDYHLFANKPKKS